ncbi:MAG: D-glycerate dehydrogenase [bacterium]|nr:D-glycerate dehydrogenase [bacterium]
MYKIFVTRKIPEAGLNLLKAQKSFRVLVSPHDRVLTKDELKKNVKGVDAVLSLLTDKIDSDVLDAAGSQLKIVANYAVGFDNVDLDAAKKRSVIVTNTPGDLVSEAVAEHTFALIMALAHRIVEADVFTRAEKYKGWEPMEFLGTLLMGKTLGIVGLGRIGVGVARRAVHGMGMKVIYNDQRRNEDFEREYHAEYIPTLDALLKKSDVVSLHVPLLPATRHLMSTKQFALMKPTAFVVNTARGPVIDEKALLVALAKKKIGGVALDVFECEPAIDCDLTDHLALKKFPNVILTPHIASASTEARDQMAEFAAQNIIAVLSGKAPLNPAA